MKNSMHFIQNTGKSAVGNFPIPQGWGWYFTSFNPLTGEGKGWYGDAENIAHYFERRLFDGILMEHECGTSAGSFWNEWGAV